MSNSRSMIFQEMDPEEIKKALEGHRNVITPAIEEHDKYFKHLSCVSCGGSVTAILDPKVGLFKPESILPNYMAECTKCGCRFEPYTKIIITLPR